MKTAKGYTSACRYCHCYQIQGRRGGICKQLGVMVQPQWKSCKFAKPIFDSNGNNLEEITLLENSFALKYDKADDSLTVSKIEPCVTTK